jgi:hypothetical protein
MRMIEEGKIIHVLNTRKAYQTLVGTPEYIRSLQKSSYRREQNGKGDLKHDVKLLSGFILFSILSMGRLFRRE